jgi:hypothetical protein
MVKAGMASGSGLIVLEVRAEKTVAPGTAD